MYQNPRIPSSYQFFDLGKIIYETTLQKRPLKVIEFGCYKGSKNKNGFPFQKQCKML